MAVHDTGHCLVAGSCNNGPWNADKDVVAALMVYPPVVDMTGRSLCVYHDKEVATRYGEKVALGSLSAAE